MKCTYDHRSIPITRPRLLLDFHHPFLFEIALVNSKQFMHILPLLKFQFDVWIRASQLTIPHVGEFLASLFIREFDVVIHQGENQQYFDFVRREEAPGTGVAAVAGEERNGGKVEWLVYGCVCNRW